MTVTAGAPLVRTRESELSAILDAEAGRPTCPTNGRNFLSLLQATGERRADGHGSATSP